MIYPTVATIIFATLILFRKRIKEFFLCWAIIFVLFLPNLSPIIEMYFQIPLSRMIYINNETFRIILSSILTFFKFLAVLTATITAFYFIYQKIVNLFFLPTKQTIGNISNNNKNIPSNKKIGNIFAFSKPNTKMTAWDYLYSKYLMYKS